MVAVEVFRFFAEIPTPIKSDKNQPIEPKLSDSQKNSSRTIEDVMAELRN
ncbi:MAG: SHOCT domain-containing protein, partial [Enterococcus faecalis]|nr:SHOCT domain-containing protein [Enterococcus faecalis]